MRRSATATVLFAALISGCATPDPLPEPVAAPEAFSASGSEAAPARWWTAFADPALDARVNRALTGNLPLEAAWQRLRAAQALSRREASDLYPDLEAGASGSVAGGGDEDDGTETELRLGATASYEVDLWGRIRARADAERFREQASFHDYRVVALTVSAELTRAWYGLVAARRQQALLEQQITTNQQVLELLQARVRIGALPAVDALRQQQLIEATREELIQVKARAEVLEHQLAVLEGRPPQRATGAGETALPSLPPLPATGLPAELVERRPDVQRQRAELRAASKDLSAAISDRYPRLVLTAEMATSGSNPGDLFGNFIRNLAGELLQPVLDGRQRASEVDRQRAVERQRLLEYGQAVLVAFREVEDALTLEARQRERIASIERQAELARQSFEQLRTQYLNGVSSYIDVLGALSAEQQLRRDLIAARLALIEFRIALYRALAGGFPTARERQPASAPDDDGDPR